MSKGKKVFNFVWVGFSVTIVDYIIYTILSRAFFNGDLLWVASMLSGVVATCDAYLMHSKITWKNKNPGKYGVIKFFIWNGITMLIIRPILVRGLGFLTGLYQFAFGIITWLRIPFDYDFVRNTGIYVLATLVVMVLNFLIYDRLIFGKNTNKQGGKKVDVESVRETREEQD